MYNCPTNFPNHNSTYIHTILSPTTLPPTGGPLSNLHTRVTANVCLPCMYVVGAFAPSRTVTEKGPCAPARLTSKYVVQKVVVINIYTLRDPEHYAQDPSR